MTPCPDVEALERYATGGQDGGARPAIDDHVSTCADCASLLADVAANLEEAARIRRAQPRRSSALPLPAAIGRFRILSELGRGGMGVVYLAEQEHPRRKVALKVIRTGLASESVLARFAREADVLAKLQHPGIAQIYDAGVEELSGPGGGIERVPYFAMELVDGEPVDVYVERHGLAPKRRLELLARICDAVEHAHAHGIVHRDLKPGNILVVAPGASAAGLEDDAGQPRILDFGVARVTAGEPGAATLATATLATSPGQLVGTLPFMSPEQVAGNPAAVDARSDVYAIGVLGYVILAGRLPYDVADRSLPEATRIIRDEEPATLGALDARYRGDVETILAKALDKDPARRYASAGELATDLRRHLRNEPIAARPPSTIYQLRKFARRNRVLVGSVLALVVVLAAAASVSTWLALRATRAERVAELRSAGLEVEADKLRAVQGFLLDMLGSPDVHRAGGAYETTVRDVLDRAAEQLASGRLASDPAAEAEVRKTLGNTYWTLGRYGEAETQFRAALALDERLGAGGPDGLFRTLNDLGILLGDRGSYAESEASFRRALDHAGRHFDPNDPEDARAITNGKTNLAGLLTDRGRYGEAEPLMREALAESRRDTADAGSLHANLNNLAGIRRLRGDWEGAAALYRELIERYRVRNPDDPSVTKALNSLATTLRAAGDPAAAEPLAREALERNRQLFGEDHPDVAASLSALGMIRKELGDLDQAEALARRALEMARRHLGEGHMRTMAGLRDLALVLAARGQAAEAERMLREVLADEESALGPEHPDVAVSLDALAGVVAGLGRRAEARQLGERALAIRRAALGVDAPLTRATAAALAGGTD